MKWEDEEVWWVRERTSQLAHRLLDLLADGEWHDREEIVQAMMGSVHPGMAIRYAQKKRYYMAKLNAKRRLGEQSEEFREWLEAHPTPASWSSNHKRSADDNESYFTGARFLIIDKINKVKRIEKRMHNGVAQLRRVPLSPRARHQMGLEGGEAASSSE
jgi:hypothetical protein